MTVQTSSYQLRGGLDLVTPGIRLAPGRVLEAQNYEPAPDGYRRIAGYERYDGQPKPSEAYYWLLILDRNVSGLSNGDIVNGVTSGASGKVLHSRDSHLVLHGVSGNFIANETIKKGNTTIGQTTERVHHGNARDDADNQHWTYQAHQAARNQIGAVPGSGPIRGLTACKGKIYALRDNQAQSACILHKASNQGWQAMPNGHQIRFQQGTSVFEEGQLLTGASSGAKGTIVRVILDDGHWDNADGSGRMILRDVSGNFSNNESITSPTTLANQADGEGKFAADDGIYQLKPGGKFRILGYNFYGKSDHYRLYGVDGVNPPFEIVDDIILPLQTERNTTQPTHIAAYQNHLFLGYPGGSLVHSGVGEPHAWSAIKGASELAIGDDITGLLASVRNNLIIFCRNKISVLAGTSPLDWAVQEFSSETGAIEGSVQKLFDPIFLDDRGVRSLATTEQYGDFKIGTYSKNIDPWLNAKRGKLTCSLRVRKKDQYRLFFSDGSGLILDISKGEPEFMPILFPDPVHIAVSLEDAQGEEILLMSGEGGFVYEMDSGASFDGAAIDAVLRLPFTNLASPTQNKRFLKAIFELDAAPNTHLQFNADFSYGDPDLPTHGEQDFTISGAGTFWGMSDWNAFYWSSQIEGVAEAHLEGFGTNLSIVILSSSALTPHALHGVTLHWSPRGLNR